MTNFYVDTVPAYLAPFVEREVRRVVAEAKRQHAATASDHWTKGDESPVLVSILHGAPEGVVTESLVQREMRRAS